MSTFLMKVIRYGGEAFHQGVSLAFESSLDLLPVKSDMAEVISRQDWTARISEERASRAETKFLLAS